MDSSARVLPAYFVGHAVQARRPVHRATKVQPRKSPRTVEELDYHENMGGKIKNRKGIISVLVVKQAVRGKRLKTRITTQGMALRLKRSLRSYKTKNKLV